MPQNKEASNVIHVNKCIKNDGVTNELSIKSRYFGIFLIELENNLLEQRTVQNYVKKNIK